MNAQLWGDWGFSLSTGASQIGMGRGILPGMTTQIAVRLPDEVVAFLDRSVAAGVTPSRAALVSRAIEREMRRQAALADARTLEVEGAADDLDDVVRWTGRAIDLED